jgi:hypothetical protein
MWVPDRLALLAVRDDSWAWADALLPLHSRKRSARYLYVGVTNDLGGVDKFDPVTSWGDEQHAEEALGELIVSRGDSTVDLEVAEDTFDAIALAIEAFAIADCFGAGWFWRDHCPDPTLLQVLSDRIGVIGFVGEKRLGWLLRQIDQRVIGLTVCRFTGREVEGDRPTSGITEAMNFTGEPAPRAAKSSLISPPFPPAAETWARTVVLSML